MRRKTYSKVKSIYDVEVVIFIIIFFGLFTYLGRVMGLVNLMNTLMNTSYQLLMQTVFFIMGIAVLAGAIGSLFSEFGVIAILNKLLSKVVKKVYGLPGAAVIGVFTTYLSDNPAILSLAKDESFISYFKKYQLPALTNLGTAFGMGLIITTFMIGLQINDGVNYLPAALIGNVGAIIGSVVSVRIMLRYTKKEYGDQEAAYITTRDQTILLDSRMVREGSASMRAMAALLDGGKAGVDIGLSIIPGVVIICTLVLLLTNGPTNGIYTGAAYEGVGLIPFISNKLNFILQPLFGFSSPEAVAVPITALGAAGAAIGLVPNLLKEGLINANDVAVLTAMCMCWSGYLSTHVSMMDKLGFPKLINKAILAHTIGGIAAGISANLLYNLFIML